MPESAETRLEAYYDQRFESGYMDDWPPEKKRRIVELLGVCGLPSTGRALDFGCGQGVFTDLVRRTLPGWQAFGSDLSGLALELARRRFPGCRFVGNPEIERLGPFDLILTHHVLEHVNDLDAVLSALSHALAPGGHMLHILPCGNPDSFEHHLCSLRVDGVHPENGRFFLDEEGHLRRLRSAELDARLRAYGLSTVDARYANHYWGAIDWLSDLELEQIRDILDPSKAVSPQANAKLSRLRRVFLLARLLKRPPVLLFRAQARRALAARHWTWRERLVLIAANPMFAAAFGVRAALGALVRREWADRSLNPAGSEMYLAFRKDRPA
jgi:SAM-dependent methyltransferase